MNEKECNVTQCLFRGLLHRNRFTVTQLLSFHFEWFIHYVSVSEREEKSDTFGHFTVISNYSYNLVCTSIVKTWRRMLLYKMVVCSVWVPMCIDLDACVSEADVTQWRKSRWLPYKDSCMAWDFNTVDEERSSGKRLFVNHNFSPMFWKRSMLPPYFRHSKENYF
jgi:hypothetical protein